MTTRKEALEVMRKNMPTDRNLPIYEALQTLIPELAESEDERVRKALIDGIRQIRCKNGVTQEQMLAWLEKQKPTKCCKDTLLEWAKLVLKCQEEELAKYDDPSYMKASTMGRIDAYKVLIAKLNSL